MNEPLPHASNGHKNLATIVYALQALGLFTGIAFIAAIILNYIRRDEVAGTWIGTHFYWQIRTFWFGLLWTLLGYLTIVFVVGFGILFANTVWVIYRIIKGWVRLYEGKEMYPEGAEADVSS